MKSSTLLSLSLCLFMVLFSSCSSNRYLTSFTKHVLGYQPLTILQQHYDPGTIVHGKKERDLIFQSTKCFNNVVTDIDSVLLGNYTYDISNGQNLAFDESQIFKGVDLKAAFANSNVKKIRMSFSNAYSITIPRGDLIAYIRRQSQNKKFLDCYENLKLKNNYIIESIVAAQVNYSLLSNDSTVIKLDPKILKSITTSADIISKFQNTTQLSTSTPYIIGYKLWRPNNLPMMRDTIPPLNYHDNKIYSEVCRGVNGNRIFCTITLNQADKEFYAGKDVLIDLHITLYEEKYSTEFSCLDGYGIYINNYNNKIIDVKDGRFYGSGGLQNNYPKNHKYPSYNGLIMVTVPSNGIISIGGFCNNPTHSDNNLLVSGAMYADYSYSIRPIN
jgi:hypothetical protein